MKTKNRRLLLVFRCYGGIIEEVSDQIGDAGVGMMEATQYRHKCNSARLRVAALVESSEVSCFENPRSMLWGIRHYK